MNHLKQLTVISATLLLSTNALANINANPGVYVGANIGVVDYGLVKGGSFDSLIEEIVPTSHVFGRPYVGFRFNDYVAVEGGYTRIKNNSHGVNGEWGADHYYLYTIDLEAKFIKPFYNGLSVFGKVGGAITHQDVFNQMYADNPNTITVDTNSTQLQPLLGIGVSYNFTKNLATDLSFTYQFRSGKIDKIQMLGLGLSYTFGPSSEA